MMGRSTCDAMACTISLVNDLGTVEVPTNRFGWISLMTPRRSVFLPSQSSFGLAKSSCAAEISTPVVRRPGRSINLEKVL